MKVNNTHCSINGWLIDHESGSVIHKETKAVKRLGEYQLKLLETLATHSGIVLSKDRLTNMVWENRIIGQNSLPNAIHALRAALEDDGKAQRVIKTIPKKGYLLEKEFCEFEQSEAVLTDNTAAPHHHFSVSADQAPNNGFTAQSHFGLNHYYTNSALAPAAAATAHGAATMPTVPTKLINSIFYACVFILVVTILAIGSMSKNPVIEQQPLQPIMVQPDKSIKPDSHQPFDKITLYAIDNDSMLASGGVPERLTGALTQISALLAERNATLDAYYQATDAMLFMAASFKNSCQHQELSLNFLHWRINNERLNSYVYQELEKKLNELTPCQN